MRSKSADTHRSPSGTGLVLHWTRETPTPSRFVERRSPLAYALGGNPYGPVTAEDQHEVGDAVGVSGSGSSEPCQHDRRPNNSLQPTPHVEPVTAIMSSPLSENDRTRSHT